jgi:hypothetical protein
MIAGPLAGVLLAVAVGCRGPVVSTEAPGQVPAAGRTPPPGNNWEVTPQQAERLFASAPMKFDELKATEHGVAAP